MVEVLVKAKTIMHGIARVGFNLEWFLAVKHAVCGDSVMLIAHPHSLARFSISLFQAPFCFCFWYGVGIWRIAEYVF